MWYFFILFLQITMPRLTIYFKKASKVSCLRGSLPPDALGPSHPLSGVHLTVVLLLKKVSLNNFILYMQIILIGYCTSRMQLTTPCASSTLSFQE